MLARVEFGIVGRTRGEGRAGSAIAASAYNLCASLDGNERTYDFSRKAREHVGGCVMLPPGAPPDLADPGALWRAAEACERRTDAQLARQILITIPREIQAVDRLDFARHVVAPWVQDGAACQVDIHCPMAADGQEQPHAHVLLTLRRITDAGFAKTKTREWNQAFREQDGRAERARISDRATAWMRDHGIHQAYDLRSLADQGVDRPPEPIAPRAAWQQWIRNGADPGMAPIQVREILDHRIQRADLARADHAHAQAADQVARLTRQLAATRATVPQSRPQPTQTPTTGGTTMPRTSRPRPATRRSARPATEPWMRHDGGMDALSPVLQSQARASYDKWIKARPDLAKRHGLDDYVSYVQDQQRKRDQDRQPDDQMDQRASSSPGIAAADEGDRERSRHGHLTRILSARYPMPDDLAAHVQRVRVGQDDRTATLDLTHGGRLVDHGDRVEHHGPMSSTSADAMIAAAAAKGWKRISLSGSDQDRRMMAMACALRDPPITNDFTMTAAMRREIADKIRERAEQAVPRPDPAALANMDPEQRARATLDHAEAKAKATLSTRPTGSTDAAEIARPALADLADRRQTTREDATEAREAADAHRAAHPWMTRLLDPAARRRQVALDADSRRLTGMADRLDTRHDRDAKRIAKGAEREAKANAQAVDDWQWSTATRRAQATLDQVEAARRGIDVGNQDTIQAAAHGDIRGASRAADRPGQDTVAPDQAEALRATVAAVQEAREQAQQGTAMQMDPELGPAFR